MLHLTSKFTNLFYLDRINSMKMALFLFIFTGTVCGCAYESNYEREVKKISDEAVKGCVITEDKVRALRHFVHQKMKFPEPPIKPDGKEIMPEDIYPLNTMERLNSGYGGFCDQQVDVFMHLAQKQGVATRKIFLWVERNGKITSPHTIAEALDGKRWVIVDPLYDLELCNKEGKMASRLDIANNTSILTSNPKVQELITKDPDFFHNYTTDMATVEKYSRGRF
ncbi:MAG: transglutaminase-like domain-containing protein [Candidatus Omnitrophota bacterium]